MFTIKAGDLKGNLDLLANALPKKSVMPILNNVVLSIGKEGLSLMVSDADMFVSLSCDVQDITGSAITTLPYARLRAIAAAFQPETVLKFEATGTPNYISIKGGATQFKVYGIAAAEFPAMPLIESDDSLSLNAVDLIRALNETGFAIAREESKQYNLEGVKIDIGEKVNVMGTDGHRASVVDVIGDLSGKGDALIPRAALSELLLLFGKSEEVVTIAFANGQVAFRGNRATLVTRTIAGKFPDAICKLMPQSGDDVTVFRSELADKLRTILLTASETSRGVKLCVDSGKMSLLAKDEDQQEGESYMSVEGDASFTVAFNGRYLLDYLNSTDAEKIMMRVKAGDQPVLFQAVGQAGYDHTIMPIRLQW